jgi:FkbM family methyltransferase
MIKLFIRIAAKFKFLNKLNFYSSALINRHKIIIPIIKGIGVNNLYMSEIWMCEVLKTILPLKQGTFLDIGINVGQTLIKLKTVDHQVNYIGFEPNPTCVFYVHELIKANKYVNTTVFPIGISDKNQVVQLNFYSDGDTDAGASMIKDLRPNATIYRKEYIPCFNFDSIQKELALENISIVKIDVEGAELEVLKGIEAFIRSMRPFILIEILPVYTPENKSRLEKQIEIERFVKEHNYRIVRIHKSSNNQFSEIKLIDEINIHSDIDLCDYIFCPEELTDKTTITFKQQTSR